MNVAPILQTYPFRDKYSSLKNKTETKFQTTSFRNAKQVETN